MWLTPKKFYHVLFKDNQHLCLLSCPVYPVGGLQLFATASQKVLPLLRKQDSVRVPGAHSTSVGTTSTAKGFRSSAAFELGLRLTKGTWKPRLVHLVPGSWSPARAFPPWREKGSWLSRNSACSFPVGMDVARRAFLTLIQSHGNTATVVSLSENRDGVIKDRW